MVEAENWIHRPAEAVTTWTPMTSEDWNTFMANLVANTPAGA
jgi:hypothetical protein